MMRLASLTTVVIACGCSVFLSSCRSTVPEPTRALNFSEEKSTHAYKMHNSAPLRTSDAETVRFVDLNQDGHIDILLGGSSRSAGFRLELGDGTGNWTTQNGAPTTMQPLSFATSDINHNGLIDVLIGGKGDQKGLQIWEFDNKNNAWNLQSTPIPSGVFSAVKFVDINHDGWDDIVASRLDGVQDGGLFVALNNGGNSWVYGMNPIITGTFTDVAVEDINGDGHLDIIASRRGGLGSIEEDRAGKKKFAVHRNRINLNKDIDDDIWSVTGGIQVWHGDGNGRWQPAELPVASDAESVAVADVNGDGYLDIVAGLYQQGIAIWLNDENQTWHKHNIINKGTWSGVKVGDLDADGTRELVATSSVGQGLHIWHWDTKLLTHGKFIQNTDLAPNFGVYRDLDLADIRNDGTLAIAATRAGAGIEVWSSEKAAPLVAEESIGKKIGDKLSIYFESGSAKLNDEAIKNLETWAKFVNIEASKLHFNIQGRADQRPIHSDLFPNNTALSKARAEAVSAWLLQHNALKKDMRIDALGDSSPLSSGLDPASLKINRRVSVQAYRIESTRLPSSTSNISKRDLYNINENKVFKVIDGTAEYKVGAGDELSLTFWQGGKSEIKKVVVQIDGTVSLPYQAALKVAGLTPREIDTLVTDILRKYERNPRVDVFVLKARSKFVSIFGEVQSLTRQPTGPGTYPLKGKESLVKFLSRAGGPGRDANLSSVQIIRNGKTIILNLDKAIRQGDLSENAIIDEGDTIFIPSLAQSKRQVYILGEVNKVGIVEFTGDINFLEAVSKSGGLTADAYLKDIRVLRNNRDQPEIFPINFQRFMEKGDLSQNLALMDKDIIIIPSRPVANWNKFIADISPSITLLLQPVSIAQQILTLRVLDGQVQ